MDEVIDAAHSDDTRLHDTHRKRILADLDYAKIATELVSCARDIRLPQADLLIKEGPADKSAIDQMKSDLGLGSSVDRLFAALRW